MAVGHLAYMQVGYPLGASMSLLVSKVPRSLESKARLFGFELGDLLVIFLYLAVSNLIFGTTRLKFPIVWVGTAVLAGTLFYVKRGRPDQYLQHSGEFFRTPGVFTAGAPDTQYRPYGPLSAPSEGNLEQ